MPIDYTPQWTFEDWVDQISLVRASGEDGFNARFHAIFAEFVAIGGHLRAIGAALDRLDTPPVIQPVTLTITPNPLPGQTSPWDAADGRATSPNNADQAVGVQPVDLPPGARLQSFTAVGSATGDSIALARLERQTLFGTPQVDSIAQVSGTGGDFTARAQNLNVPPTAATYKYRISFRWNILANPAETGSFSGFQIVYLPPN